MLKKYSKRSLFYKCLAASLTLHVTAVFVALKYPHFFRLSSADKNDSDTLKIAKNSEKKTQFLKFNADLDEALSNLVYLPQKVEEKSPSPLLPSIEEMTPQKENVVTRESSHEIPLSQKPLHVPESEFQVGKESTSLQKKSIEVTPKFHTSSDPSLLAQDIRSLLKDPVLKEIQTPLSSAKVDVNPQNQSLSFNEAQIQPASKEAVLSQLKETIPLKKGLTEEELSLLVDNQFKNGLNEKLAFQHECKIALLPSLSSYDLPEGLAFFQSYDDMPMQVQYCKDMESDGYLFAITLNPKIPTSAVESKQKFYFILDRTNSVGPAKFSSYKRAIVRALSRLSSKDEFNIFVVDKDLSSFSKIDLTCSQANRKKAETFLNNLKPGAKFSAGDIYKSLSKVVPSTQDPNVFISAILLSDGETILNTKKQQELINKWMQSNPRTALFTGAIAQSNNLVLLDLLGSQSQGKLIYSDTHSAFPRKLAGLIKVIKDPLVPQMNASYSTACPDLEVSFYPTKLPVMYNNNPYVIIGRVNKLEDFSVLLEGRCNKQWIQIKKDVSFAKATKANKQLEILWNKQKANSYYEKFLQTGDPNSLKEAEKITANTINKRS